MIPTALSGDVVEYMEALDRRAVGIAGKLGATPKLYSPLIDVASLRRVGHFESFPHLTTLVTGFELTGESADPARTQPVQQALTTAACYPMFASLKNSKLEAPTLITTRNTCFRLEDSYEPLERQWSFNMREVVYVGHRDEAERFIADAGASLLADLASHLELDVEWKQASDPFFNPLSGGALLQASEPLKMELLFDGRLAIGSTNMHHAHFGRSLDIDLGDEAAESACVAMGLERWMAALTQAHGVNVDGWPEP